MIKLTGINSIDWNNFSFSEQSISKVKSEIVSELQGLDLKNIYNAWAKLKKIFLFGISLAIIVSIIALIFLIISKLVFNFSSNWWLFIIAAFFWIVCFFINIKMAPLKAKWNVLLKQAINQKNIYKTILEENFENLKISNNQTYKNLQNCCLYKSREVPVDAIVHSSMGGINLILNDKELEFGRVTWKWTRTYCNGKSCVTRTYYKDNFYIVSSNFESRWNGFDFFMTESSLLQNKGKELENDEFNKKYSYTHNDPIKLRILLTPFIQETFVKYFSQIHSPYVSSFVKKNNYYILFKTLDATPFTIDVKMSGDLELLANKIWNDILSDIHYVVKNVSIISTFRELVS